MKNRTRQPLVRLAMAAVLGAAGIPAAQAALVVTVSDSFSQSSGNRTSSCTAGVFATTCSNTGTASTSNVQTSNLARFDPSLGVLTGVTIGLQSTLTQSVSGTITGGGNRTGTAGGRVSLALSGELSQGSTLYSTSTTSAAGASSFSNGSGASSSVNVSRSVDAVALNAYAGAGTVGVLRNLQGAQATSSIANSGFFAINTNSTTYNAGWSGTAFIEYTYLLHAAAAFGTGGTVLDLDFGTRFLDEAVDAQTFDILNVFAAHRTGLDLDGFSSLGANSPFATNLAFFSNLAAGSGRSFEFTFDTSALGSFQNQMVLNLSDANVGASSTWQNHQLTINLRGSVIEREVVNQVPEPQMLALVGLGLMGLALTRRRRR